MRVAKALAAVALIMWVSQCGTVVAQDDLDLDALLNDLTGPAAEAETTDTEATVEETEELSEEDLLGELEEASDDAAVEEDMPSAEMPEEAAVEPAMPEMDAEDFGMDVEEVEVEPMDEMDIDADMAAEDEWDIEEVSADMEIGDDSEASMEAEAEPVAMEEAAADEMMVEAEAEAPMSGEAAALAAKEEIRRQALEQEGLMALQRGIRAAEAEKYEEAIGHYREALEKVPERRATIDDIEQARMGLVEAQYELALTNYKDDEGDIEEARQLVEDALKVMPNHRPSLALLRKIAKKEERLAELAKRPTPVKERPEIIEKEKDIEQLLAEAIQYYKVGDYTDAEALFDQVLLRDEYNVDAMRYLKKLREKQYEISTREREATVAAAIRKVRDSWNPPIEREVVAPPTPDGGDTIDTKTSAEQLREKMSDIMIPSIEFRQANIQDVVSFLVDASIEGDEEGVGVNIILNLNVPGQAGMEQPSQPEPMMPQDEFFDDFGGGLEDDFGGDFMSEPQSTGGGMAASSGIPTITLNLRRISLLEALKIITEVAGLRYRVDGNVVIITPVNMPTSRIVTRMYPVQPSFLDVIIETEDEERDRSGEFIEMGGGRTTMKRGDVKEFFQRAGVQFPVGSSITYNATISQLIVANTTENLEAFERILAKLNVIPHQVEIEARFVEIAQSDLQEMGLEWILTDNWEIAQKEGIAPLAATERIQVDADGDGFSQGLRFFTADPTTGAIEPRSAVTAGVGQSQLGSILSISSILTNPELSVVLHALNQQGGSDLLSAPRVTTRSGVNAQIQVVREIIYPTEFEVTQPTIQSEGNLVTPPTVTPGGFETRETGVILNVTPTVGPDGYTIDLTMIPEVSELVDWIQYGSEVTLPIGDGGLDRTFVFNIPQPVFSSRNVTTSIVIWDGQTVVMGGLIREDLVTVNDKVPLLGDIPVLGRLFRSEGQSSEKRNLLIFVTARLVDPAGKPIHKADEMNMPGAVGGTTAEAMLP